ncbi:MAG TPA: nuclear transport factor 2 family protein [Allosphingosinicella sp.]|nr:nuclear transport factor 2 family protein [Allosphingosinicella sp.]
MIVRLLRYGLMAWLVALAIPCRAAPEDGAINAVYVELARARTANDVAGMSGAFAAEGLLIDSRPGPPISGGELAARLQPMRDRLVADGRRIDTQYRVERRSVMGDLAVDAGFMRQSVVRPDGQSQVRYARFLVTMRRESDRWRIIADASMPATEEAWNAVVPGEGRQFDS